MLWRFTACFEKIWTEWMEYGCAKVSTLQPRLTTPNPLIKCSTWDHLRCSEKTLMYFAALQVKSQTFGTQAPNLSPASNQRPPNTQRRLLLIPSAALGVVRGNHLESPQSDSCSQPASRRAGNEGAGCMKIKQAGRRLTSPA